MDAVLIKISIILKDIHTNVWLNKICLAFQRNILKYNYWISTNYFIIMFHFYRYALKLLNTMYEPQYYVTICILIINNMLFSLKILRSDWSKAILFFSSFYNEQFFYAAPPPSL